MGHSRVFPSLPTQGVNSQAMITITDGWLCMTISCTTFKNGILTLQCSIRVKKTTPVRRNSQTPKLGCLLSKRKISEGTASYRGLREVLTNSQADAETG